MSLAVFKSATNRLSRWGWKGTLGRYLLMKAEMQGFLEKSKALSRPSRAKLLQEFQRIHRELSCAHPPYQLVLMADKILQLQAEGPIVECGCFKGGSAAKLSQVAKLTGRKLYLCDSFQGLPALGPQDEVHTRYNSGQKVTFSEGEWAGSLSEVQGAIERYGCPEVCEFVPGFFSETLPKLDIRPACVFIDVDLISSARDCLVNLWPQTAPGGLWFTHEANLMSYLEGVFDGNWWLDNLKQAPPLVVGAGTGLSVCCPNLALFNKPE